MLIRFPQDESGANRKLSRPWHGPYRVVDVSPTGVTAVKLYFPNDPPIQVHQLRVCPCPPAFTPGFYWYGQKRLRPGRPPKWIEQLLADPPCSQECDSNGQSMDPQETTRFDQTGHSDTDTLAVPLDENEEEPNQMEPVDSGLSQHSGESHCPEEETDRPRLESGDKLRHQEHKKPVRTRTRTVVPPDRLMRIRSGRAS